MASQNGIGHCLYLAQIFTRIAIRMAVCHCMRFSHIFITGILFQGFAFYGATAVETSRQPKGLNHREVRRKRKQTFLFPSLVFSQLTCKRQKVNEQLLFSVQSTFSLIAE